MVKLVPALLAETRGAVRPVSAVVLQVTDRSVPNDESGCTRIVLPAATAVVLIVQVPVEALVAQENDPDEAALHDATEGFAAEPAAAHLVAVLITVPLTVPAKAALPLLSRVDVAEGV